MWIEANSQCGGFGSACCRFTSECLSLEAKSVRFGGVSYSGGWKMKIQLCAAQLMHCGVLMRTELTGHLDVNIRWLVDWLESFTGQHAHHARGEIPGGKGRTASLDVEKCLCVEHEFVYEEFGGQDDGFPAKYIMWRLPVTAAVDEVSGRSVEYRQLCPSVWVEKDILIKMATRSWSC